MLNTLENIFNLARERKKSPVDGSYTNKLLSNKSLSKAKVLEEINELIEAVEKDQGCKMINGVELQYPKANQSVIQKAKYESKKFECIKEDS